MKIGLYFGSFNPIHVGHCIIGSFLRNETDIEQVWFVVSPQNPFKESRSLLNEYDRLHLVQTAIEGDPYFRASDIEFHLQKPSYTCNTLVHLEEKYPQHTFSLIMGSDSLQNLDAWKNGAYIRSQYDIYVYSRPGFPLEGTLQANIIALHAPLLEISATQIRSYIREKKSIRYMVTDAVRHEIERNNYYK